MRRYEEWFEKHKPEYLKFNRVKNKKSKRPDLHAFICLDKWIPGNADIVSAAEHDEIFLCFDEEDMNQALAEDRVIELLRCGVRLSEYGCLALFV